MKVILINHQEEYAVREMVTAFFPKTLIEFIDEPPKNEDYILSQYSFSNNIHSYYCEYKNSAYSYSDTLISNTYDNNIIKKTIYNTLNKATNIELPWGILTGIRPAKMVRELKSNNTENIREYLISEYYANRAKVSLAINVEENEEKIIENRYKDGISLYIGIPFCPTRCLYCSFTSQSVAFSNKLTEPYVKALLKEIKEVSKMSYIKDKIIETVYFGGGTPTALTKEQIDIILSALEDNFDLNHIKEITFEAGRPDTIDEDKLITLKKHNIDRICINPQTLNDKTLKIIGRNHTCDEFYEKYKLATSMGFNHINCDIIAGLPEETTEDFIKTVNNIITLKPQSITVHTMSIKHGSFLDMKYNNYTLTTSKEVNDMLDFSYNALTESGKIPYYIYRQKNMLGNLENVGYSDVGHESLYNIYIMEEIQTIVALGAGGSTKVVDNDRIERVFNVKEVSEYITRVDEMIKRKKDLFESFSRNF